MRPRCTSSYYSHSESCPSPMCSHSASQPIQLHRPSQCSATWSSSSCSPRSSSSYVSYLTSRLSETICIMAWGQFRRTPLPHHSIQTPLSSSFPKSETQLKERARTSARNPGHSRITYSIWLCRSPTSSSGHSSCSWSKSTSVSVCASAGIYAAAWGTPNLRPISSLTLMWPMRFRE